LQHEKFATLQPASLTLLAAQNTTEIGLCGKHANWKCITLCEVSPGKHCHRETSALNFPRLQSSIQEKNCEGNVAHRSRKILWYYPLYLRT